MQEGNNPGGIRHVKQITARRRPRSLLLVVLLVFALVITGILGWQALDAERSHRLAAERALKDYARFAAWQLNQQAAQEMLGAMISGLNEILTPEELAAANAISSTTLVSNPDPALAKGTKTFQYDSCEVAKAASGLASYSVYPNAWMDNFTTY